ncbi:nucleoside triphosphate pyrophosphohydrolase [Pedomonas mirosovicensis]|uniref:nucleoside triphosphate pyrophosphohydrolase n=1 Tax=Pedomonas mirosovicensis TaxID=2908641 RepID=UPI00216A8BD6|nr:nucleoside triphosphate pyrophosphohydrolase [Pedomonas mirosovicensis]
MSEGLNASPLPEQRAKAAETFARLVEIMATLRDPESGCPWDLEQTFETIAPYTLEEAYEVAEAIRLGDRSALREELGDLLLQVVYHARMAEEEGSFDIGSVAEAINAKMIRRHPHVFGDATVKTAEEQTRAWEELKARERAGKAAKGPEPHSALDGVATALPALLRAQKIQARAARVGFDWRAAEDVVPKIEEELEEVREAVSTGNADRVEDEVGDLLFAVVNLARKLDIDAEGALRRATHKFESRFRAMEHTAGEGFSKLDLDAMEVLWQKVKKQS